MTCQVLAYALSERATLTLTKVGENFLIQLCKNECEPLVYILRESTSAKWIFFNFASNMEVNIVDTKFFK